MKQGDLVRHVHGNEEGIITSLSGKTVDVEIEDGFVIPFLKRDLVVVSAQEETFFEKPKVEEKPKPSIQSSQLPTGTILIIGKKADNEISFQLLNRFDNPVFVGVYKIKKEPQLLFSGILEPSSYHKLRIQPKSSIQILSTELTQREPIKRDHEFDIDLESNPKQFSYILELKINGVILDALRFERFSSEKAEIDISKLQEALNSGKEKLDAVAAAPGKTEVDLHIEALTKESFQPNEILPFQLKVFEQELNRAIASGSDDITFIHGVGNGKLRMEIHRILSGHEHISFFQDAQKQKFGYGATLVKLK